MAGFKRSQPGLAFAAEKITPDEIDMNRQYVIAFPAGPVGIGQSWFGTQKSGTADVKGLTLLNVIADFPRTLEFSITGSSVGQAGSIDVVGKDQFGSVISETLGFGSADNGGTVDGTRIFAQITTGTVRYGTFAGVNGTVRLGGGTLGTSAMFGLPDRIGANTDVKAITFANGTGAVSINGGTIGTYVYTPTHAIRTPLNVLGTTIITVVYKTTYDATNIAVAANLSQRA